MKHILLFIFLFTCIFSIKAQDNAYIQKGKQHYQKNELAIAQIYLDSALNTIALNDITNLAYYHIYQAKIQSSFAQLDLALESQIIGHDYAKQTKDTNLIFWSTVCFGEIARAADQLDLSLQFFEQAKKLINNKLISSNNKSYYYNRRAAMVAQKYPYTDSTFSYCHLALFTAKSSKDSSLIGSSYNELGYFHLTQRQYDSSLHYFRNALNLYQLTQNRSKVVAVYGNLCQFYGTFKEFKNLIIYADSGLVLCEANWHYLRCLLLGQKSDAEYGLKMYQEAYDHYRQSIFELNKYNSQFNDRSIKAITSQLKLDNAKLLVKTEQQAKENALQQLRYQKQRAIWLSLVLLLAVIGTVVLIIFSKRLKRSLENEQKLNVEKDFLIREVHHRVKNNLQSLSSLLNIQLNYHPDALSQELLQNIIRRVDTIGVTHSMLYKSNDFINIQSGDYLKEFTNKLSETTNSNFNNPVKIITNIENVALSFDQSVSIGMIVSEMISNSNKYAQYQDVLTIKFSLTQDEQNIYFSYHDSGDGSSTGGKQGDGLGTKIIQLFIKKLGGDLDYNANPYHYTFHFPKETII